MATPRAPRAPGIDVKSGGKVAGYGESSSVDLVSGLASFSLPVATPKVRDVGPSIALTYSGAKVNGPFGLGFSFETPAIVRSTRTGIPRYGRDDRFIMAGSELTPKYDWIDGAWVKDERREGDYLVIGYRSRIESTHNRTEWWVREDGASSYWKVVDDSNATTIYGQSQDCRIFDPSYPQNIYQWSIESSTDTTGNVVRYIYKREDGVNLPDDGHPATTQLYVSSIQYGNWRDDSGVQRFAVEVLFDYGEYDLSLPALAPVRQWPVRADPFSSYRAGFELRTWRLCRNIFTVHHFPDDPAVGDCLTNIYALGYDETPLFSSLKSFQRTGFRKDRSGKYLSESMPAITLEFGTPAPGGGPLERLEVDGEPAIEGYPNRGNFQFVDLYGDGIAGILYNDDHFQTYWRALGEGRYAPPQPPESFPRDRALSTGRCALVDVSGGGHRDLVVRESGRSGYYRNNNNGTWEDFVPFVSASPEMTTLVVEMADLSASGRLDLLVAASRTQLRVYPSLGARGYGAPTLHPMSQDFPSFRPGSEREVVLFADMFGDGLQHRVRFTDGMVEVWPSLGHGRFGPSLHIANAPRLGSLLTSDRIFFADVTGSGFADLILAHRNHLAVYRNQSGNSFAEPLLVLVPPGIDDVDQINWADVTGDGEGAFVITKAQPDIIHYYLRFTGEDKPYLLKSIDNNFGLVTEFRYRSSTAYQLADRRAGRPWAANLSTVVQVVDSVTVSDRTTGWRSSTHYQYADGCYDAVEREFRGFGYVQSQDTETFSSDVWHFPAVDRATAVDPDLEPVEPCLSRKWNNNGAVQLIEARSVPLPDLDGAPLVPANVLGPEILACDAETVQQAYRALKDREAAQAVFGVSDDGTSYPVAYTMSAQNYLVALLQPCIGGHAASFQVMQRQSRSLQQDRQADDIRIIDGFNLRHDEFGNVTLSSSVAYPRPGGQEVVHPEQQNALIVTAVASAFINHYETAEEPFRHIGVACEQRALEINGIAFDGALFDFTEIDAKVSAAVAPAAIIPYGQDFTPGSLQARPYRWTRDFYWNADRTASLPLGQIAAAGLLCRQTSAIFSVEFVAANYGDQVDNSMLEASGGQGAGYSLDAGYWWNPGDTRVYGDETTHFSALSTVDPFGRPTRFTYDRYYFGIATTTDALGQTVASSTDYQAMQPDRIVDVNGNTLQTVYGPLDNMVAFARYGVLDGRPVGDRPLDDYVYITPANRAEIIADPEKFLQGAGSYYWEDFLAPSEGEGPVNSIHVEANRAENPVDADRLSATGHGFTLVFVDGRVRTLCRQSKVEAQAIGLAGAEDAWVTANQVVYNSQGKVVRRYNPYVVATSGYVERPAVPCFLDVYDAVGRVVRSYDPKGFFSRTEFQPWQKIVWDANDTVEDSAYYKENIGNTSPGFANERDALVKAAAFYKTPTTMLLDPLGRDAVQQQINVFPSGPAPSIVTLSTGSWRTVSGEVERQVDPRFYNEGAPSLFNLELSHDMTGQPVRVASTDRGKDAPGTTRSLRDVYGNLIYEWDNRGMRVRHDYDQLRRLIGLYVAGNGAEYKAQDIVYGSDPSANTCNRVAIRRDEAQESTFVDYDLLGLPLSEVRRFPVAFASPTDWTDPGEVAMLPEAWRLGASYNRRGWALAEFNADGSVQSNEFYCNGWRRAVSITEDGEMAATTVMKRRAYDAAGAPTDTEYGNGALSRRTYDSDTMRLVSIVSERTSDHEVLQNDCYFYDPVGNVTRIVNHVDPPDYLRNGVADAVSDYTYDAIYRLRIASGRQQATTDAAGQQPAAAATAGGGRDPTRLVPYTETYTFDLGGNLLQIRHDADIGSGLGPRTRNFAVSSTSNHSVPSDMIGPGITPDDYFDRNGNLRRLPNLRAIDFDYRNRMVSATIVVRDGADDDAEYYTYDSGGQRRRKVRKRRQAGGTFTEVEETFYIGNYLLTRISRQREADSAVVGQASSLAVMAGEERLLVADRKGASDPTQARYQLANNQHSVAIELDPAGLLVTYEEYFPYGGAAFAKGRSQLDLVTKRYRYVGKEQDGATGLYCIGLRYYIPCMGRWLTPDPQGAKAGLNLYSYVQGNPTSFIDLTGLFPTRLRGPAHLVGERQQMTDDDHTRALQQVDAALGLLQMEIGRLRNSPPGSALWGTVRDWSNRGDFQLHGGTPYSLVSRYFGIDGQSPTDISNLMEIHGNFVRIKRYLERPPVESRRSWRYVRSFFIDTPQFTIEPHRRDELAYVQGASVNWPDWRILPQSVRSRPVGLATAAVVAGFAGAIFGPIGLAAGFLLCLPGLLNAGVPMLRRMTSSTGIHLRESHFAEPDRNERASTLVHESSHLVLQTADHAYGFETEGLTTTQSMYNADSYGLFARDAWKFR